MDAGQREEGSASSPDHALQSPEGDAPMLTRELSSLRGFDVLDDAAVQRREADFQGASLFLRLP